MRRSSLGLSSVGGLVFVVLACSSVIAADEVRKGFRVGTPKIESAGPIAFVPDGVLLVADTMAASIHAIEIKDAKSDAGAINVEGIDAKVAALLGTEASKTRIDDLAVNPKSGKAYLAVSRGTGPDATPVIVRLGHSAKLEVVSLENVPFSTSTLPNAPDREARGRRGAPLRLESITDLAYVEEEGNAEVVVAGLSNEEFASTLRSIPYPFTEANRGTGVEIFHGAHGRLETNSPVRTFVPFRIEGTVQLLAAYTCTPLVRFPVSDLKPGAKIRGTTIAELGNRNRPLDMIVYKKDGKDHLLIANSSRGVMKVSTEGIMKAEGITEHVRGGARAGQPYETVEGWTGIEQLDRLDDGHAIVLKRTEEGRNDLATLPLP